MYNRGNSNALRSTTSSPPNRRSPIARYADDTYTIASSKSQLQAGLHATNEFIVYTDQAVNPKKSSYASTISIPTDDVKISGERIPKETVFRSLGVPVVLRHCSRTSTLIQDSRSSVSFDQKGQIISSPVLSAGMFAVEVAAVHQSLLRKFETAILYVHCGETLAKLVPSHFCCPFVWHRTSPFMAVDYCCIDRDLILLWLSGNVAPERRSLLRAELAGATWTASSAYRCGLRDTPRCPYCSNEDDDDFYWLRCQECRGRWQESGLAGTRLLSPSTLGCLVSGGAPKPVSR